MLTKYKTVFDTTITEINVKKSRFIAEVFHIENEKDFAERMEVIKKKHRDAKHHVFAYRLADNSERYSDDGEPSGTAGVPILDILRGKKLYDVLIVVTRYFGGTLLGTGGLVKAYSDVTKLALENVSFKEMNLAVEYELEIPYDKFSSVQHYCSTNNITIKESSFSDVVLIKIQMKKEAEKRALEELSEKMDGKVQFTKMEKEIFV